MDRKLLGRRIVYSTHKAVQEQSTFHQARLTYLLYRTHYNPREARIAMHLWFVRSWPKRMWWRYIILPYILRHHEYIIAAYKFAKL